VQLGKFERILSFHRGLLQARTTGFGYKMLLFRSWVGFATREHTANSAAGSYDRLMIVASDTDTED
jgi:hypothetical protein